ncbi:MAG TPA: hypothetical protein VMR06_04170 [Dokdonella sp.]|uniref:hypothetical protein n=1 Tax=Dokdonella sp. TaxID=2291710 RepID=UPI002C5B315D|nr:hypothetical protein [Dokdonella sp.]HUD41174.1 hypothetical protein [Dokdonella sp.]
MNRLRLLSSAAALALPLAACSPSPSPPPVEALQPALLDAQQAALEKAKALQAQADRHAAELDRAADGGQSPTR